VAGDRDGLLVTNGCQQAMDLLSRVLVRDSDAVVVEDPVYPGLKNVFARPGVRLIGVETGSGGMDPGLAARVLAVERPRMLILTPNFQNPTGSTLPLESRMRLAALAREHGTVLVENDIYGQLRYRGEALPAIKRLDPTGDSVYLGSFSKVAFPGLRVGWVIAPRPLIARLTAAKQSSDLHTDQLSQAILLRFAKSGRLAAHLERIREAGAQRLKAVLESCALELPEGAWFTKPDGGMNLWVRLPGGLDAEELAGRARRQGVAYLPGRFFAVHRVEPGSFRLSFAGLRPEEIRTGLARLGRIFREEWERLDGQRPFEPATALV
jgi:2-aminoadipate transaminase